MFISTRKFLVLVLVAATTNLAASAGHFPILPMGGLRRGTKKGQVGVKKKNTARKSLMVQYLRAVSLLQRRARESAGYISAPSAVIAITFYQTTAYDRQSATSKV